MGKKSSLVVRWMAAALAWLAEPERILAFSVASFTWVCGGGGVAAMLIHHPLFPVILWIACIPPCIGLFVVLLGWVERSDYRRRLEALYRCYGSDAMDAIRDVCGFLEHQLLNRDGTGDRLLAGMLEAFPPNALGESRPRGRIRVADWPLVFRRYQECVKWVYHVYQDAGGGMVQPWLNAAFARWLSHDKAFIERMRVCAAERPFARFAIQVNEIGLQGHYREWLSDCGTAPASAPLSQSPPVPPAPATQPSPPPSTGDRTRWADWVEQKMGATE